MKRHYLLIMLALLFASTLSNAAITVKFHKPDSWTEVSLYSWGPEVLGGWPGTALTEVDGWYEYTFEESFTSANLIFNNNGAGEQTVDFVISSTVCLEASNTPNGENKYEVTVVPCNTGGIEVRFIAPESWTAVNLYSWGPEVLGGWPGASLTEAGGWYLYAFDAGFTGANLIFNNGTGQQTMDYVISESVCLKASNTPNAENKFDVTEIDCTTGINEKFYSNIVSLYPNPVASNIELRGTEKISEVRILTLTGEEALLVTGNRHSIDVSTLQPGVYFIRIEFENGMKQLDKIVKL